jgi:hypothetical protein
MKIGRRLIVAGLLAVIALSALLVAKRYSVSMIAYVVEEALVQKLPAGIDPALTRSRFQSLMSQLPDRQARLEKLLAMSQYLEKLQTIDREEWERLLTKDAADVSMPAL